MDDVELDRALKEAFSVNPSPEFAARVRTKVAEAPRPSGWLTPALVVACVVTLAIAAGLTRIDDAPAPAGPAPALAKAGLKPSTTNTLAATNTLRTTNTPSASNAAAVVPTSRSAEPGITPIASAAEPPLPEVLIAREDIEGLRQFVAGASEVRFVASFDQTPAPVPWVIADEVERNN